MMMPTMKTKTKTTTWGEGGGYNWETTTEMTKRRGGEDMSEVIYSM